MGGGEDFSVSSAGRSPDAVFLTRRRARSARLLVVSGAKGGVGKTLLATNLAIYFATIGRRVLLLDADPESTNAHTFLGMEGRGQLRGLPSLRSGRLSERYVAEPFEARDTPIPNLQLAQSSLGGFLGPSEDGGEDTLEAAKETGAEYIVVDLGSGLRPHTLGWWRRADLAVFVVLPEPAAVESAYQFVEAVFASQCWEDAEDETLRSALEECWTCGMRAPIDVQRHLASASPDLAHRVATAMQGFRFSMVVNQTRLRADLELGDGMCQAAWRRLGLRLDYLGYVDHDDTVWSCVRSRRPVLVECPGTKASRNIEKIARRLIAIDSGKVSVRDLRVPRDSFHDLLEVERGATEEEIRRAYKRAKEVYGMESMPSYGLFRRDELAALQSRLEEAHDVLLDPERRRPYEIATFPEEVQADKEVECQSEAAEPRPEAPVITPQTEFTGALLRNVRESQGIDLKDVSQRTKIGVAYLRAIEDERYESLPAPVYVRGFVSEFAKLLKLDRTAASRTYMKRLARTLAEREQRVSL